MEQAPDDGSQLSAVQVFESPQFLAAPAVQEPAAQMSLSVQALPSVQLTVLLAWAQPVETTQESSVQTLPSSQLSAVPVHEPPEQASLVVQALPSLQGAVLLANAQLPVPATQLSLVQALLSLQTLAAPAVQILLLQTASRGRVFKVDMAGPQSGAVRCAHIFLIPRDGV